MNDTVLSRLVRALDAAVETAAPVVAEDLHSDLELASLRLRCLDQLLGGGVAEASPYLAFLRRTTGRVDAARAAASA